jgi:hypothetical protein
MKCKLLSKTLFKHRYCNLVDTLSTKVKNILPSYDPRVNIYYWYEVHTASFWINLLLFNKVHFDRRV